MPPPELAADAPWLHLAHPGEEGVLPLPGHELRAPGLDRLDRGLRELGGVAEPLRRHQRLDHGAAALRVRHLVHVRLGLHQQAETFQLGHDQGARGEPVLPFEPAQEMRVGNSRDRLRLDLGERHATGLVQHRRHVEPVPLPDGEIVEVMRRRDLHRAGALLGVGVFVLHDRDLASDERQDRAASVELGETGILGMHGDGDIAQHRLRPRRRDGDEAARLAHDRVLDVPEMAVHLAALHFEVGDRRAELRVPVDQPAVAIDEPLAVERDEHLAHRARERLVHGEALARPIERGAETAELARDGAARFALPLPHALDEARTPERGARCAFAREQALDHELRRDARMVGAGLPQRVPALHAPPADQRVLQGEGERVAHMQAAGHVRRRDHDGERGGVRVRIGGERAGFFPLRVEAALDLGGREILVQHAPVIERFAPGREAGRRKACTTVPRAPPRARSRPAPDARPRAGGWCRARS